MSLAISPMSGRRENAAMDPLSAPQGQGPTEDKKTAKSSHKKSKSKSSSPCSVGSAASPALLDGFRIRLLLVSGKKHDFAFEKKTSIRDLKSQVFLHWPQEWRHEHKGSSPEDLRILYHGRFLDDHLVLNNLQIDENNVTTLHLVPKPSPLLAKDAKQSRCFPASCTCTIL